MLRKIVPNPNKFSLCLFAATYWLGDLEAVARVPIMVRRQDRSEEGRYSRRRLADQGTTARRWFNGSNVSHRGRVKAERWLKKEQLSSGMPTTRSQNKQG